MENKFRFEDLRICQIAMEFGGDIFNLSVSFPEHEMYNLTSQIRRTVDSVALNIPEGSSGKPLLNLKGFLVSQSDLFRRWYLVCIRLSTEGTFLKNSL